jgi:hypothetical protein
MPLVPVEKEEFKLGHYRSSQSVTPVTGQGAARGGNDPFPDFVIPVVSPDMCIMFTRESIYNQPLQCHSLRLMKDVEL